MSYLLRKIVFLLGVCGSFAEATGIKELLPTLPVDEAIRLQMGIDEFQRISSTVSEIIGAPTASASENRVFGEDVGKGEISLSSKETVYYYFLKGQLARLEWKDKSGKPAMADAKEIKQKLEKSLGIPERVKKSFFGGDTGIFQATEEIYRSSDGVELQFVASVPFFSITVTDTQLLQSLGNIELFNKITDDHSIKEWNRQNASIDTNILDKTCDYLLAINTSSGTRPRKPDTKDTDILIAGPSREGNDEATSVTPPSKSDHKLRFLFLLGAIIALGMLLIAVKARKDRSA